MKDKESIPAISLCAYEIQKQSDMELMPAPVNRVWMDATYARFAYRCLPMTIANQAGWVIQCPRSFVARWNGGPERSDTTIAFEDVPPDDRISSLFGHGVVTFNMPYLFRTSPGCNIWVKGPSNWPKVGLYPLEGIVETDWTAATFTMNWKILEPNTVVSFQRGEPICMIVPFLRNMLENCQTQRAPLEQNKELSDAYWSWSHNRNSFHKSIAEREPEAIERGWQKDYFQGRDPGSERFEGHQTRLHVPAFRRQD